MTFQNQVVIVTGSSSGIGKATALKFAQLGAKVVVNSKSNVAGGNEVVAKIKNLGGQAIYLQGNLANNESVKQLFTSTMNAFGTVDILINNAGSTIGDPFLETKKETWVQMMDDNLMSAVLCAREAAKIMLQNGKGKIINTSSVRGIHHTGREGIMAYSAAKAAVINFTKTLAKELAPKINVNAVVPGFVYTENYDNMSQELKDSFIRATMIKRFINVDEIADAFIFLSSADAITGEILVVDGGFTLKLA